MIKVSFLPLRKNVFVPRGVTILDAARKLGLGFEGPCNGAGRCGKDIVHIRSNGRLETVLACKTPVETDLEVIIPCRNEAGLQSVESFHKHDTGNFELNPYISKKFTLSGEGEGYTSVYFNDSFLLTEQGDTTANMYGMAVDLGTTTIAAALVDLTTGSVIESSSILNPLVSYGHDVLSRIRYANQHGEGLRTMHRELISAVNLLIEVLVSCREVDKEHIYHLTATGNTTMQHIFLNEPVKSIGEYPYIVPIPNTFTTSAEKLGIKTNGRAQVTTFPCMSAYVGGDIAAGLTAVGVKKSEMPALFIDIGTNGEMALLTPEKTVVTSCAAGPCFEGMTISTGMRAAEGAIEAVTIDGDVSIKVIGGGKALGICGSGLLELVSGLLKTGMVNRMGRLQTKNSPGFRLEYEEYLCQRDGKRFFRLTDEVTVTQEDIRQVQLARAAIRTGVEFLLLETGVGIECLKNIIIAGGFGYHLSADALFRVGIVPGSPAANLHFVGNSSLEGARRALTDRKAMDKAERVAKEAEVIELSNSEGFESRFVREMSFGDID